MSKRRGNNEGTIHRREDGSFRAQITLEGKRLSHSAKTRQECQTWLKQKIGEIDQGLTYKGATMHLNQFVELWLATVKETRKPKTYFQYAGNMNRYILPAFGNYRLQDLHPLTIEKFLIEKREEGIGERTVQVLYAIFHICMESAVRKGIIGRNPLDAVEKPRVKHPKEHFTLDSNQVQQFLIAAKQTRNSTLYHVAIHTDLREGEILGLKWEDLDWEKNLIRIRRQIQRLPKQGLVFSTPKTTAGKRVIALGSQTMIMLAQHKQQQELERERAGDRWKEFGLIFPTPIGTPTDPHNLRKVFKELLEVAGLPEIRFHDLRHTSITLILNELGAPIKEAQKRAGHTNPSTTIGIYGGETASSLDVLIAQKLDELITPVEIELHQNCTEKDENIHPQ